MSARRLEGSGFKVDIERYGGHLRAYVFDGIDSRAVSIAMWTLLAAQCREYAVTRLLVIEDLDASVGDGDIEAIVQAMSECGFAGIRIAFVELRDDVPINEQGEILALERGITVQVFSNEADARNWLLYGGG